MKLIAFYLPQFHPIPENDRWWGKGFTEWTNVARAVPLFPGHEQPKLPADLGFYDLRLPETREAQAALAAAHGIGGFCYHHFWFSGRRLLERPFEDMLATGHPDFPFCVSWANENWTRRWDGQDDKVLVAQDHGSDDDIPFIDDLMPALRDERYLRVKGRPLIIVYHTGSLPAPVRTTTTWRERARRLGIDDLFLLRAETHAEPGRHPDPRQLGFDAAVEFPPHALPLERVTQALGPEHADFRGTLVDYAATVRASLARPDPAYPLFRCAMPGWDNTPRRKEHGVVFTGSTPALYEEWLGGLCDWTRRHHPDPDEQIVFVNSWNEWAEGATLEPDQRHGRSYLEATARAMGRPASAEIWEEPALPPPVPRPPRELSPEEVAEVRFQTWLRCQLTAPHPRLRRTRLAVFRALESMRNAFRGRPA